MAGDHPVSAAYDLAYIAALKEHLSEAESVPRGQQPSRHLKREIDVEQRQRYETAFHSSV